MKGGVALIIPVLEEGETIAAVVRAVPRDVVDEVIVVDGGSADDIVARAKNAGARVIVEPRSGYGAACLAGVRATDRRVIVFIDGDGSDDPAEIPRHARDGLKALKSKPSGGRQRENMSLAEE